MAARDLEGGGTGRARHRRERRVYRCFGTIGWQLRRDSFSGS